MSIATPSRVDDFSVERAGGFGEFDEQLGGEQVGRHVGGAVGDQLGPTDLVEQRVAGVGIELREARIGQIPQRPFGERAIGDRVAELLRISHESAGELRAKAEEEAEDLLGRSRLEAERMTTEAEATLLSARTQSSVS